MRKQCTGLHYLILPLVIISFFWHGDGTNLGSGGQTHGRECSELEFASQ